MYVSLIQSFSVLILHLFLETAVIKHESSSISVDIIYLKIWTVLQMTEAKQTIPITFDLM